MVKTHTAMVKQQNLFCNSHIRFSEMSQLSSCSQRAAIGQPFIKLENFTRRHQIQLCDKVFYSTANCHYCCLSELLNFCSPPVVFSSFLFEFPSSTSLNLSEDFYCYTKVGPTQFIYKIQIMKDRFDGHQNHFIFQIFTLCAYEISYLSHQVVYRADGGF